MTAVISTNTLDLLGNPLDPDGQAQVGRAGHSNRVYVNSATRRAKNPGFIPYRLTHGPLADLDHEGFATRLAAWSHDTLSLARDATHFGYIHGGRAEIECESGSFHLSRGMYFCIPRGGRVRGESQGIVVSRSGYFGFFQIGGPTEERGRLDYIDGCTDSLLVPPILLGDPCLNLLHFPPHIHQTQHTHPSMRIGIVASGRGECLTPEATIPLVAGGVFGIPAHGLHGFSTGEEPMRVIAYHPDSDFGATHERHPMINRTMVNGVSASYLDEIRTRRP